MSYMELPSLEDERRLLAERLQATAAINGIQFGETVLDVGGRDGVYVPVLGSLGVNRIVLIDPAKQFVEQAVETGLVPPEDAHAKTIQEYAAVQPEPADAAFVMNMRPELADSERFVGALTSTVRSGGLILATTIEYKTNQRFMGFMGDRGIATELPVAPSRFIADNSANAHMQLWRLN
jgi:2-polyprenyl-3-methyl-5-hydroxy-6-metoxy-1,4-benzoquinol methylase